MLASGPPPRVVTVFRDQQVRVPGVGVLPTTSCTAIESFLWENRRLLRKTFRRAWKNTICLLFTAIRFVYLRFGFFFAPLISLLYLVLNPGLLVCLPFELLPGVAVSFRGNFCAYTFRFVCADTIGLTEVNIRKLFVWFKFYEHKYNKYYTRDAGWIFTTSWTVKFTIRLVTSREQETN